MGEAFIREFTVNKSLVGENRPYECNKSNSCLNIILIRETIREKPKNLKFGFEVLGFSKHKKLGF